MKGRLIGYRSVSVGDKKPINKLPLGKVLTLIFSWGIATFFSKHSLRVLLDCTVGDPLKQVYFAGSSKSTRLYYYELHQSHEWRDSNRFTHEFHISNLKCEASIFIKCLYSIFATIWDFGLWVSNGVFI